MKKVAQQILQQFVVATAVLGSTAAMATSSPPPRPDVVGEIVGPRGLRSIPVVIVREGTELPLTKNFTPLYQHDRLYTTDKSAAVHVEYLGGRSASLDPASYFDKDHAFEVPSCPPSENWTVAGFLELISLFPATFDPPSVWPPTPTTPNQPKGSRDAPIDASVFLPEGVLQYLDATAARFDLPIIWKGGRAHVRLETAGDRSVISDHNSELDGFVELSVPPLLPGQYVVEISTGAGRAEKAIVIPIKIVNARTTLSASEEEEVLFAAKRLHQRGGSTLQALADLDRLAQKDFKAWALYRSIVVGN